MPLVAWKPPSRPSLFNFLSPVATGTALGTKLPTHEFGVNKLSKIKKPIKMFDQIVGIPLPSRFDT